MCSFCSKCTHFAHAILIVLQVMTILAELSMFGDEDSVWHTIEVVCSLAMILSILIKVNTFYETEILICLTMIMCGSWDFEAIPMSTMYNFSSLTVLTCLAHEKNVR